MGPEWTLVVLNGFVCTSFITVCLRSCISMVVWWYHVAFWSSLIDCASVCYSGKNWCGWKYHCSECGCVCSSVSVAGSLCAVPCGLGGGGRDSGLTGTLGSHWDEAHLKKWKATEELQLLCNRDTTTLGALSEVASAWTCVQWGDCEHSAWQLSGHHGKLVEKGQMLAQSCN